VADYCEFCDESADSGATELELLYFTETIILILN
jgi:hypothetical protein